MDLKKIMFSGEDMKRFAKLYCGSPRNKDYIGLPMDDKLELYSFQYVHGRKDKPISPADVEHQRLHEKHPDYVQGVRDALKMIRLMRESGEYI